MSDPIVVTMTADDRDLLQSFMKQHKAMQNLEKKYQDLKKESAEAGKAAKQAADSSGDAISSMVTKLGGVAAGWFSATAAVTAFMEANKRAIEESDSAADKLDGSRRRTQLLTKLRGPAGEQATSQIEQQAIANAVSPEIGHKIAQQMAGSGFDTKEIVGGALDSVLKVLAATGEDPNSPEAAGKVQAMSRYFESQGIGKNAKNVLGYGSKIQALMGPTDLTFENLQDLSKVGAGFRGVLSPEEQLATFSNLVGVMPGAEAGTKLADIVKNFRVAGSKQDATAALGKMGLKPGDVDFVGENLGQVLDRMKGGLGRLPEEERASIMAKVVEGSNIATLEHLMTNRDNIYGLIPQMNNQGAFNADVALMQGGRGAAARRIEGETLVTDASRADTGTLLGQELQLRAKARGDSNLGRDLQGAAFGTLRYSGASPETAARVSSGGFMGLLEMLDPKTSLFTGGAGMAAGAEEAAQAGTAVSARMGADDRLAKALEENNKLVQKNNELMQRNGQAPRGRGQVEPGANQ